MISLSREKPLLCREPMQRCQVYTLNPVETGDCCDNDRKVVSETFILYFLVYSEANTLELQENLKLHVTTTCIVMI